MERSLELTSISNARELGGLTAGGRVVKKGRLLRTGSLAGASKDDLQRLTEVFNVTLVVDFRMTVEQTQNPDPSLSGVEQLSLPIFELQDTPGFSPERMEEFFKLMADRTAMLQQAIKTGMLSPGLYRNFLLSDRGKQSYRSFFQALLRLSDGQAVLWHCTDGKDRTGIAAMLLLTALGASRQTIMKDYLLTNDYNATAIEKTRAALDRKPMDSQIKKQLIFGAGAVYEEYLEAAFTALDENYGSVEAYLATELGVGEAERAALQERFLD